MFEKKLFFQQSLVRGIICHLLLILVRTLHSFKRSIVQVDFTNFLVCVCFS